MIPGGSSQRPRGRCERTEHPRLVPSVWLTLAAELRPGPSKAASDGQRLASASSDQTVRLWDPATGTAQATLTGHAEAVTAVAFSPDGQRLASASWDQTVRVWDLATGTVQATLTGHAEAVTAVAFSPDGQRLASASTDQTVRLSSVNAVETVSILRLDTPIQGLAWSRNAIAVAKAASVVLFDVAAH
jgi:WD40 repeat protein